MLLEYEENGQVTTVMDESALSQLTLSFGYKLVNQNGEPIVNSSISVPKKYTPCNYPKLRDFIAKKEELEKGFDR